MINTALLYEAMLEWAPDYPRQSTYGQGNKQRKVTSQVELKNNLEAAAKSGPGYVSVYSFPEGHSQDNCIPKIDTVFLDLDIPKGQGSYDPKEGGSLKDWRRDMSKLLVRARMVAQAILDNGEQDNFRISYSGHKGIHIYIDMEAVDTGLGPIQQYKNGISSYANGVIDALSDSAGVRLHEWVDVTSHDLGRLARLPNTPHHGAEHVDWTPYCVPGSVEELAKMDPDGYLEVTRNPRPVLDGGRSPSGKATAKLTQKIRNADQSSTRSTPGESKHRDNKTLENYKQTSNDAIGVKTVKELLIQSKPCIAAWADRDDAYEHGQASRTMEIAVIKELSSHDVPIDVIVEFFSEIPRFDRTYTEKLVKDIIARYYPSSFVCSNIVSDAPEFCLGESCHIYNRADDLDLS